MTLASVPMAVAAKATLEGVAHGCLALGIRGLSRQLLVGLVPVAVGGAVYLLAARALRLPELTELAKALRRRRARPAR